MASLPKERFSDVTQRALPQRAADGVGFALVGIRMTLAHRELRALAVVCVLLNFLVYGGLAALGFWLLGDVGPDPAAYEGWVRTAMEWVRGALQVLLLLAWLLLSIWLAIFVTSLLASPFFDLLSERTEELLVGRHVGAPFSVSGALRSGVTEMLVQLKLLLLYVPVALLILSLNLIPAVGQIASSALAWVWTSMWVAMTFVGPTAARHELRASQRAQLLFANKALSVGFGAIGGVPFLSFVLLPLLSPTLVVGMTRMFLALAAHDRVQSKLSASEKAALRAALAPEAEALSAERPAG